MKKIVIASACRTAIGKFGGTLSNVPAAELGSIVIKEAINRAGITPEQVDHVYMGCVIQAGLGQNVARQASLKAGLPVTTPAVTVNVVCGSGLNCVNMAAQMIEAGDADIVVAGGTENMDMAPFAMMKGRYGYRMGSPMGKSELVDTMVNDALWDAFNNYHMGITAENVAEQWGLTREDLDNFAYSSQVKADAAIKSGAFKDEIVPVVIKNKKGDIVFDTDEGPRLSPPEVLAKLKPAFKKDGIVTKEYLDAKGIAYIEKTGNTNDEIMTAAASLVGQVDAVFTPTDNVVMAAAAAVSETLTEGGIPFYTGADSFVTAGAFATCGVNYTELGTYTADMALEVLETGTVPEYHVMDGGIITVNTDTAAALGIDYSVFNDLASQVVEVTTSAE